MWQIFLTTLRKRCRQYPVILEDKEYDYPFRLSKMREREEIIINKSLLFSFFKEGFQYWLSLMDITIYCLSIN